VGTAPAAVDTQATDTDKISSDEEPQIKKKAVKSSKNSDDVDSEAVKSSKNSGDSDSDYAPN
jgi:hypothetical protein